MTISSLIGLPCSSKSVWSNSDVPRDQATTASGRASAARSVLLIVVRAILPPLKKAFSCPSSSRSYVAVNIGALTVRVRPDTAASNRHHLARIPEYRLSASAKTTPAAPSSAMRSTSRICLRPPFQAPTHTPAQRRCNAAVDAGTEATVTSEGSGTPSMLRSGPGVARAANGQATAAPPASLRNSRLLILPPKSRLSTNEIYLCDRLMANTIAMVVTLDVRVGSFATEATEQQAQPRPL